MSEGGESAEIHRNGAESTGEPCGVSVAKVAQPHGLTDKQRRFVAEPLVDFNATQAAIRAGYSKRTAAAIGAENLRKPRIAAALASAQSETGKRLALTKDWALQKLMENVDRAMQAEAVVDRQANETGEYRYDGAVANKAPELLGSWASCESSDSQHCRAPFRGGDRSEWSQRVRAAVRHPRKQAPNGSSRSSRAVSTLPSLHVIWRPETGCPELIADKLRGSCPTRPAHSGMSRPTEQRASRGKP